MISKSKKKAIILDYDCGSGSVVQKGRSTGLEIFGADLLYGQEYSKLNENIISSIKNGKLAYKDNYFNLITSNQVQYNKTSFSILIFLDFPIKIVKN